MVLCLLAADDAEEDVALQIHFTLIQAFCCENDINILRVSNMPRLAEILGGGKGGQGEPADLHCVLVTVSGVSHAMIPGMLLTSTSQAAGGVFSFSFFLFFLTNLCSLSSSLQNPQSSDPALSKVNRFCRDSRCLDQWVPVINLPDR